MKNLIFLTSVFLVVLFSLDFLHNNNGPIISNLTYDNITQTSVTLYWTTSSPADSKIKWMASDSNYQPLIFTDSIYNASAVTNHVIPISGLLPARIYKCIVTSQNGGGTALDSGYFLTESLSSGRVDVYFDHSVDTTVSTGEKAKGNQDFETLFDNRIDSVHHSIDVAMYDFSDITSIATALINAKNRGVVVRFITSSGTNSPILDSIIVHGIPVLKRNYDTTHIMHNKFMICDYRYNTNTNTKFLWTGSTNVTHAQIHQDKNNIIVVQDESLCAVYTREFEEMWGSHTDLPNPSRAKFGTGKVNDVPHILNVEGTRMEVYFSPSDSVPQFLCNLIKTKTTKSVFICIYTFKDSTLEDAMHTVFNNGSQISGVFDLTCSSESESVYPRMKGLQVPNAWNPPSDVFIDSSYGLLHHKYLIIDANSSAGNKITVTGSYNWTIDAALSTDENSLTIFSARVNNLYYQEFAARYRGAGGAIIGLRNIGKEIPSQFSLSQNYPNPFNPTTNIRFQIPATSQVTLKIYNVLGQQVAALVNEKLPPGRYQVEWDASNFASGVYFYKLTSGEFSQTNKMIILK